MFETVLSVNETQTNLYIEEEPTDLDGLNYLTGKTMDFVNKNAMDGTILAHTDGGVPVVQIKLDSQNEIALGELLYFFEIACGISGYILGINPFNQPGVEADKKNMFALLDKPGYEEEAKALRAKL